MDAILALFLRECQIEKFNTHDSLMTIGSFILWGIDMKPSQLLPRIGIHTLFPNALRYAYTPPATMSWPVVLSKAQTVHIFLAMSSLILLMAGFALNGAVGHDILIWAHRSPVLPEMVWANLTLLGSGWALILVVAALDRRGAGADTLGALLCLVVAGGLISFAKWHWPTPRPGLVLEQHQLVTIGDVISQSGSMPSGHAAVVAALLTMVIMTLHKRSNLSKGVLFALVTLAVCAAWSRVAIGAHWPADILIGMSVGVLGAQASLAASRRICSARLMRTGASRPWRLTALCLVELVCAWTCLTADTGQPSAWLMQYALGMLALSSCVHRLATYRRVGLGMRAQSA